MTVQAKSLKDSIRIKKAMPACLWKNSLQLALCPYY